MKVTKEINKNRGITLISLVITIIVMLILVSVTISMAVNGGLFDYAGKAVGDTKNALNAEQQLGNGAIQVDGVWYDSIDDYLKNKPSNNQGEEERIINAEYVVSEGENLWSSTVTLNLSIENSLTFEEKKQKAIKNFECSNYDEFKIVAENFTGGMYTYEQLIQQIGEEAILDTALEVRPLSLNQMRELAAYMLDCSNYDELKNIIESMAEGATYEQFIANSEFENEEEFLKYIIDTMKCVLNYRDIDKLESLGVNVITIKTPYDTTLYASSLDGTAQCTFMENGEYTFTIESGGNVTTKTVEVNNVRNYDEQAPHDIKLDFIKRYTVEKLLYSIDDEGETQYTSDANFQCQNSILFEAVPGSISGTMCIDNIYAIKDKQFFKYFNNNLEWEIWNDIWIAFDNVSQMLQNNILSSRQYLFRKVLTERKGFKWI